MGTTISIKNLTKRFGDVVAVNNVSLTINRGPFRTLLAFPVAENDFVALYRGLEAPNEGEIYIGDKLVFSRKKGISLPRVSATWDWFSKAMPCGPT